MRPLHHLLLLGVLLSLLLCGVELCSLLWSQGAGLRLIHLELLDLVQDASSREPALSTIGIWSTAWILVLIIDMQRVL